MDHLEALLAPAEYASLRTRDLGDTVCVVFDVLRATSTLLHALARGAESVEAVADIPQALARRAACPDVLLAGERDGIRIDARRTGGVEFDLGNSPREFTGDRVCGRRIVMTTTNGTRALQACAGASTVLASSFGNLSATARWLGDRAPSRVLLVCSGTQEHAALEDCLAAGALADLLWSQASLGWVDDAVRVVRELYRARQGDLLRAVSEGRNGHRLMRLPDMADDVPACLAMDQFPFVARLQSDGCIRAERVSGGYRQG